MDWAALLTERVGLIREGWSGTLSLDFDKLSECIARLIREQEKWLVLLYL
jgi:hypothetical protein